MCALTSSHVVVGDSLPTYTIQIWSGCTFGSAADILWVPCDNPSIGFLLSPCFPPYLHSYFLFLEDNWKPSPSGCWVTTGFSATGISLLEMLALLFWRVVSSSSSSVSLFDEEESSGSGVSADRKSRISTIWLSGVWYHISWWYLLQFSDWSDAEVPDIYIVDHLPH